MYIAEFATDGSEWIQGTATIDGSSLTGIAPDAAPWDFIAGQLSAAARIPQSTVGFRVTLDRTGVLHQMVMVTVGSRYEDDLREVFARLTRLERMFGAILSLPSDRAERDGWMERLGGLRLSATIDGYSVAGVPLACNFRVARLLDELLLNACITGDELVYQIHLRAADIPAECVRLARKNMLVLHDLRGIPAALIDAEEQLARGLGRASALCEEYLAVESAAMARFTERQLSESFRASHGTLGFPAPNFSFERGAHQDPLVSALHSHDLSPLSPIALCGLAEPVEERDRLLAWRPSPRLAAVLAPGAAVSETDDEPRTLSDALVLPEPDIVGRPAAFVSYSHRDLSRVIPVIRTLQDATIPVWYDRGIPGGSEWDEVIEHHLRRARVLVVCASNAAIDSKYVRREVKFADALNVPIVPVLLEPVTFAHGMEMLLTQYQMLDAGAGDFDRLLPSAIRRLWSAV